MSILKVARMGHPVLRAKARTVDKHELRGAALQRLIDDMLETMAEYHGVGLAAPQVHEGLRLFVATLDADDDDGDGDGDAEPLAIVNPEITVVGADALSDLESLGIRTYGRDPTGDLVAENRRVLRNSPVIVQDGEVGVTHTAMFDSYFNLLWSEQSEIDGLEHQRLLRCLRNPCPMIHR